jgi:hypothetical protein
LGYKVGTAAVALPISPILVGGSGRNVPMPRLSWNIAIALLMLAIARPAAAQTAVKIHEILRNPGEYNEHEVAVFGHVEGLSIGPHYDTFRICGGKCLNVLAWGHPRISEGQALSVRGRFHLVAHIDHHRVHHVIEVKQDSL